MALSLELSGILWWNFAYTQIYWHDVAHEIVKWHLGLVEVLPRFKFWKQWNLTLQPFGIFWSNIADTLILTRFSSGNCKMTFNIGRGFAKSQILKKWKWPCLLNWVKYFDRLLRKHWYYQDLAQEIMKCQFSSVEVLPSSKILKKWKSLELSEILWWNFAYKFCILTRCSPWDCQMTFGIGRGFAEVQILKKWKLTLKPFRIFEKKLQTIWCWKDLAQGIAKWHLSSVEGLPSAKFWKSENGPISWTEWNILINLCVNIDIDKI